MENLEAKTVKQFVLEDYRTADVFKKWGINYCCGGNLPLQEVCQLQNLDADLILNELEQTTKGIQLPNTIAFQDWSIEFLVDYISNVHHAYLKKTLPQLQKTVADFIQGHKKKHAELEAVQEAFEDLCSELLSHTEAEEQSIFPYLKQINSTYKQKEKYGRLFVRTLSKPLNEVLEKDHRRIAALVIQLREVTHNYQFPEKACTNHQVIYHKLKELDTDLVQHKHLENNILYPRVLIMEKELSQCL
jgi:regulator of cell morphogenesis and NO signaling